MKMKNVDYQLRQFVEVAKHKSLSDAAVTLRVTQSALSKQLREIETAVGHPMFRRHGRGVELTEQGATLWRAAQTAYKLVDATISALQAVRPALAGGLTGTTTSANADRIR
jgi:DNA-binding transcriptional LysR family regulator